MNNFSCIFHLGRKIKTMAWTKAAENEVFTLMKELKNKESACQDGITYENLKFCSPVVEKYLEECKFPQCMKCAKVVPFLKKGDRINRRSYRPISLLASVSKLFDT